MDSKIKDMLLSAVVAAIVAVVVQDPAKEFFENLKQEITDGESDIGQKSQQADSNFTAEQLESGNP